jgi:hypothetical protein
MFDWAKGSKLRDLIRDGVPGAGYDPWLEGWMVAYVQHAWTLNTPLRALEVTLGDGPRPYLDAFRAGGASVATLAPAALAGHRGRYDLVTLLSFERERCLGPLDFDDPLPWARRLLDAARCLEPGGILLWSHLYCFPDSPDRLHSFLEPAALYQVLTLRGYWPLRGDGHGTERLEIYHHLDTLFVPQQTTLAHGDAHRRITRVLCAVARPGGVQRLAPRRAEPPAAAEPSAAPAPREPSGRELLGLLSKKVWAKAGRFLGR